MSVPITQGLLRTTVASMNIGDYIAARYTASAITTIGTYSQIGTVDTTTVAAFSSTNLDGYLYLIKIAKGLLVPNIRNMTGATYNVLNLGNSIYGNKVTIDTRDYLVRVPTIAECTAMMGTLNGTVAVGDMATNFGATAASTEIIQENFNLTQGIYRFTSPASASNGIASATATNARLVLEYADDSKCTDVFH